VRTFGKLTHALTDFRMKEEFKCQKKGDESEVRRFLILSTPVIVRLFASKSQTWSLLNFSYLNSASQRQQCNDFGN